MPKSAKRILLNPCAGFRTFAISLASIGEDAPRYLEKLVEESLKELESQTDEPDQI